MSEISVICAHCSTWFMKERGQVNKSVRAGMFIYCSRECSGLGRRTGKLKDQRIAEKAEYDRQRRAKLGRTLLEQKRQEYRNRLERDPEGLRAAQKSLRERRKAQHAEYIKSPRYREWKVQYDKKYRARKGFGDFGEAAIILNELEAEITSRASWVEIRRANGTLNKHQERKREYARQTGRAQRG